MEGINVVFSSIGARLTVNIFSLMIGFKGATVEVEVALFGDEGAFKGAVVGIYIC
jgi:hypothetical protein